MAARNYALPKKVGLALGSGSARGWAHIGVLRALAEAGIEVEQVAGTSIGALVGAAVALNKTAELEDFARRLDWKQVVSFLDLTFPRSGLLDGKKILNYFRKYVDKINIEDLPRAYRAVATDLGTGQECVISHGDLFEAIRASISVPGIFTPVRRNSSILVDGGLLNPVPVSVARNMGAQYVIAVDLNADNLPWRRPQALAKISPPPSDEPARALALKRNVARKLGERFNEISSPALTQMLKWLNKDAAPNIFEVLTTSINIMESRITAIRLATDPPDLLIQPRLGEIRFLDFHRADEAISAGYEAALERLELLRD